MIAAEVRRAFAGAGGLLSDSNENAGFSFQISETPPPARASSGTPLADLVLDMGDFGQVADPSPLPPSEAPPLRSAWVDESAKLETPQPPAKLEAPKPEAPAMLKAPKAEVPSKLEAPKPEAPSKINAPIAVAPTDPPKADSKRVPAVAGAPQIKKISFPVAKGKSPGAVKAQQGKTPKARAHEDPRSSTRTKFSKSISAQEPRPALDSEPEVDAQAGAPTKPVEMAPPEDLPDVEPDFVSEEGGVKWDSDTPSAREIWKKARTSWHAASKHAVALSGQGLRASKALADTVNGKVREHLREASEERASRAHLKSEREGIISPEAIPGAAPPPIEQPRAPSMAGRVILGLARSAGRKVAAPASAVAAAALVYFIGSHFLGEGSAVALSRGVKSPEVPELGTLEAALEPGLSDEGSGRTVSGKTPSSGEKTPKSEKTSSNGPPPMETELTEMPKGMSWPGKGLIEVVTSQDELVYVDGVFTGRGPLRRIPVSPGEHEVSIRADGKERKGSVEVLADKNTRAVFKGE